MNENTTFAFFAVSFQITNAAFQFLGSVANEMCVEYS